MQVMTSAYGVSSKRPKPTWLSASRASSALVPADGRGSLLALADGGGRGPGVALAARAVRVFDGAVRIGGPATIPGAGGVSETREPRPAYGPQTSVL